MFQPDGSSNHDSWKAVEDWFSPGRVAALLGFFLLVLFSDVLLGHRTFIFRDFGLYSYPVAFYHRESFWRGEVPLWNPLSHCGLPFAAQWGTMVFYPFTLFYLLLPLSWSLGVFSLLHLFWGGLGMYFLARRWSGSQLGAALAAVVFTFNGMMLNSLLWPHYMVVLGWMPFVVLTVEAAWREGGRQILLAALAGTMQMLGGVPEIILLTWLMLAAMLAGQCWVKNWPRLLSVRRFVTVVLLVTGLAAVQLFPFLDFLAHSHRSSRFGNSNWSMPLLGWLNLWVPLFQCHSSSSGVWFQNRQAVTSSYYLGAGILVLGLASVWLVRGRRVQLLAALTGVSLILSLGEDGRLYQWLRDVIPPLGFMRYPIKFFFLAMLTIPLLAACAFRNPAGPVVNRRNPWRTLASLAAISWVLIGVAVAVSRWYPTRQEQWTATLQNGLARGLFLVLVLAVLYGLQRAVRRQAQIMLAVGLVAAVWLDLATHVPKQNPTTARTVFTPNLPILQNLKPLPRLGETRAAPTVESVLNFDRYFLPDPFNMYLLLRIGLSDNCNLLDGIPKVDGFFSLFLAEGARVLPLLYASTNSVRPALADFLGVSQVTSRTNLFAWESRSTHLPLITGGQQPEFLEVTNTLRALAGANFNPRQTVYLPPEARAWVSVTNTVPVRVTPKLFAAHRVECEVEAGDTTLVVIAQAYYHPWRAYVDGQPARLLRANHAFQAVQVPRGSHQVTLVYEDRAFRAGAVISIATLLGLAGAWFRLRRIARPLVPSA